jgi:uncharacterized damage-inducible protein DinB
MDPVLADNIACLDQAKPLLRDLSASAFRAPHAAAFDASIGQHLRHVIDHYACFLADPGSGTIDYTRRDRRPDLENDPDRAARALEQQRAALQALAQAGIDLNAAVEIREEADGADAPAAGSTLRRELQFLLSHTVHHYALIGVICRDTGRPLPDGFGIAPSTLRHRAARQTQEDRS